MTSAYPVKAEDPGIVGGLVSTGDLVNRGGHGSSGGLLSRGAPVIRVGLWSTCGPWCIGDLERCGGPVEGGAPGIEGARQREAVHLTGSFRRTGTSRWRTCCNPAAGPSVGTRRGLGTWPSGRGEASAFAEIAAVKTVTGEEPGRWRTVGAGSGAAAVPGAVEQKMNDRSLFTN